MRSGSCQTDRIVQKLAAIHRAVGRVNRRIRQWAPQCKIVYANFADTDSEEQVALPHQNWRRIGTGSRLSRIGFSRRVPCCALFARPEGRARVIS